MYKSTIIEASAEISKVEAVALKSLSDCEGIDTIVNESLDGYALLHPVKYVMLHVENDKAKENPVYDVLVIIDRDGSKYKTGSTSFIQTFKDIFDELQGEEGWALKVFGRESKNYKGKKFLTCSAVYEA